jgi:aminoglycoside phosphotransferase (APT) family kinase protein
VLEWALAWLERHAPASGRVCLVHADLRTGNFLVDQGRLTAVLDWEFAAFSDPLEDLGWMLARYWRFGAYELEAGGISTREALLAGYEAASERAVDRAAVAYWEVMATVRWAVIALMQAARHFEGRESSLELALTAHVLPVLELDLLTRIQEIEERGA